MCLTAFVHEYFNQPQEGESEDSKGDSKDKSFLEGYKKVLNSKSIDDSLVSVLCIYSFTQMKISCMHMSHLIYFLYYAGKFCKMGARSWKV